MPCDLTNRSPSVVVYLTVRERIHEAVWNVQPVESAVAPLTPQQRALIRLCIAPEAELGEAFRSCFGGVDLDSLDHASCELLGLAYRRLSAADLDLAVRSRLSNSYRTTWHRNQTMLHRDRPLLEKITELTGRSLVLKGGAMVSSAYYDDLGVRPLMDLDVLVDRAWVEPIVEWALAHEWRVLKDLSLRDAYTAHHAVSLEHGTYGALDLHWAMLVQDRNPIRDRELQSLSHPATLGEVAIHVLPPTLQLFHTIAHAKPKGIRHLVDVFTIVDRAGDSVDWSALVDEVTARRTVAYALPTLCQVEEIRPGTVPPVVLGRLARGPRHWSDYAFHGESLTSRRGTVHRLAAEVAGRARGTGPLEKIRVARALIRRYRDAQRGDQSRSFAFSAVDLVRRRRATGIRDHG